jgi:hypothetical protein
LVPSTPSEWRDVLAARLDQRWNKLAVYDAYYEGDQPLHYATEKFNEVYGGLFHALSDNWCQIVVDSSVERLRVQGFRFGQQQEADGDAWDIWQANGLDGEANMLHTEAVKLSEAYWLVSPPNGDGVPRITAEHPSQVIVAVDPANRRKRLAALKKWKDDDGYVRANVYLPDQVYKWRTKQQPTIIDGMVDYRTDRWNLIERIRNPLGTVPVVPAPNNPSMLKGGKSDLSGGVIELQNAINKLLADMLIGSEYKAFPQRVLLGIDAPKDANGRPIPLSQVEAASAKSHLWMFPGKDAKAFEFSPADLTNFRGAIDGLIRDLTAQTRTPPHYVSGQIVNASGDALKAAETGLVSKVRDKMDPFGEAHEEAMRLAFRAISPDDPRAQATDAETIWRDPESRSQAEVVDAATKLATLGVPNEVLWEKCGFSPQEIDRMKQMAETDALLAASLPQPVPQAQPGQPPTNGNVPQTPTGSLGAP